MHQRSTQKSTTIWTQFPICTSSHIYWSLIKNLQIVSKTSLNYDPEEFWSMVTSTDWPATLTMSFILANVAPAAEIGVMATCMCCWSPPVVMPTVAPVIVWYMETGIVTIPGKRKQIISSFMYKDFFFKTFYFAAKIWLKDYNNGEKSLHVFNYHIQLILYHWEKTEPSESPFYCHWAISDKKRDFFQQTHCSHI